jgi:D-alanyl-D-alanine carboxypeptidase
MVEDRNIRTRTYAPRGLVARVADKQPDFAPATSWNYSSIGTILAGLIIEQRAATGSAPRSNSILEPLRLRPTSFPGDTTAIEHRHSHGYGMVDGELRDMTAFNASAAWAACAIVTTAGDVAHYWRALLAGKLLAPTQLEAMKTTVVKEGLPIRYGLAIMEWETGCGTFWGHGGDLPGLSHEFVNTEDGKHHAGVIVNVNPIPDEVADGPLGAAKASARADTLDREYC